MDLSPEDNTTSKPGAKKKKYESPALIVYGDIRDLTKNAGPKGAVDGGGGAAAGPKTGT